MSGFKYCFISLLCCFVVLRQALANSDQLLLTAARNGDAATLLRALEQGADVNTLSTQDRRSALIIVIDAGHTDLVPLLLQQGANVNIQQADGWTALMQATYHYDLATVEQLLAAGADISLRDKEYGNNVLHLAARRGATSIVKTLLATGADVAVRDQRHGNTALINAASGRGNALAVAKLLVSHGANVNVAANDGWTRLMAAVQHSDSRLIEFLLQQGAAVNVHNKEGRSALMLTAEGGDLPRFDLLLQHGAELNTQANDGTTLLDAAIRSSESRLLERLLTLTIELDQAGKNGLTALMTAARLGTGQNIALLLAAGANVNALGKEDGTTALMWAANRGLLSPVRWLLQAGADPGVVAKDGWTAAEAAKMIGASAIYSLIRQAEAVHDRSL